MIPVKKINETVGKNKIWEIKKEIISWNMQKYFEYLDSIISWFNIDPDPIKLFMAYVEESGTNKRPRRHENTINTVGKYFMPSGTIT